jgi:hypothetical protein
VQVLARVAHGHVPVLGVPRLNVGVWRGPGHGA